MSKNIFFTSDNHFGHKNILNFCKDSRKNHTDIEEMNEDMISIWNSTVSNEDTVYCLGDFSLLNSEKTSVILSRLKGNIHLIRGNHDHWVSPQSVKFLKSVDVYKKIVIDKKTIILFHFPIVEFEGMYYGSYHLYGHVHNRYKHPGRAMDVGIDARPQKDMGLFSWEEVDSFLKDRPKVSRS